MLTTQERIDQMESPIARELCQNYADALADALAWSNDVLPEEFQQHKEWEPNDEGGKFYGSSLSDIQRKLDAKKPKQPELSPTEKDRAERAWRIEKYIDQLDGPTETELEFIEDELRLHRAQVTFAKLVGIEFDE